MTEHKREYWRKGKLHRDNNLPAVSTDGFVEKNGGKMVIEKRVFNKLKTKLEEFIQLNLIKYYLNKIKRNVKDSSLLIQEENYIQKAEKFISFIEKLLSNPELCFIETKFARIEDECSEILLACCDASERAKLTKVPLYYPRFYEFLYLCKNKKLKP